MSDEERQHRLDRVRLAIWAELLIGLMVVILTGYVSVSRVFELVYATPLTQSVLIAAPVVSLLGWVAMLRLSRPRPEAGDRTWRYRENAA